MLRCRLCRKTLAVAYVDGTQVHFKRALSMFEESNYEHADDGRFVYRCTKCSAQPLTVSSLTVAKAVQQAAREDRKSVLLPFVA